MPWSRGQTGHGGVTPFLTSCHNRGVDDSRRESEELQARLPRVARHRAGDIPRPSRPIPKWLDPTREASEGRQIAGVTAYEVAMEGLWSLSFVAPAAVVWLVRRFRHT
jgi:hypothetical protein